MESSRKLREGEYTPSDIVGFVFVFNSLYLNMSQMIHCAVFQLSDNPPLVHRLISSSLLVDVRSDLTVVLLSCRGTTTPSIGLCAETCFAFLLSMYTGFSVWPM